MKLKREYYYELNSDQIIKNLVPKLLVNFIFDPCNVSMIRSIWSSIN